MRVITVIDKREVVEKILRHLSQWSGTSPLALPARPPEGANQLWSREPCNHVYTMPDCKTSSPTDPVRCAE